MLENEDMSNLKVPVIHEDDDDDDSLNDNEKQHEDGKDDSINDSEKQQETIADDDIKNSAKKAKVQFQNDNQTNQIMDLTSKARDNRLRKRNERKMNLVHGRVFINRKENKRKFIGKKTRMAGNIYVKLYDPTCVINESEVDVVINNRHKLLLAYAFQ